MAKVDRYRDVLRTLADWEPYLRAESGLPGPRGNLELAHTVAQEGDETQFRRWASLGPDQAPENTPDGFLAVCGVIGLGWIAAGAATRVVDAARLSDLRCYAADPRWRLREAVAMALQYVGDADMDTLLGEMERWAQGNPLEQRAAAAALCEPRLLHDPAHARRTLAILDAITAAIPDQPDRRGDAFKTLRQGLGYCWSVAVAALPAEGKPLMEKWLGHPDPDIRWIVRENLKKARLERMDPAWLARARAAAASGVSG
jgi:hypothetical protein